VRSSTFSIDRISALSLLKIRGVLRSTTGKFGDAWWGMFNRGWLRAECFVVTSSELLITGSRRFVQWLLM
jgi:hypothetical protein